MKKYQVFHRVDELGGQCMDPEGWVTFETDDIDQAKLHQFKPSDVIRRTSDGAEKYHGGPEWYPVH